MYKVLGSIPIKKKKKKINSQIKEEREKKSKNQKQDKSHCLIRKMPKPKPMYLRGSPSCKNTNLTSRVSVDAGTVADGFGLQRETLVLLTQPENHLQVVGKGEGGSSGF